MAQHDFGIMQIKPKVGQRFDVYEPDKYDCISVDDDFIEPLLEQLASIDFNWHTVDITGKGLAYYGITLIPPTAIASFIDIIKDEKELQELKEMLMKAKSENKYVIHYGI